MGAWHHLWTDRHLCSGSEYRDGFVILPPIVSFWFRSFGHTFGQVFKADFRLISNSGFHRSNVCVPVWQRPVCLWAPWLAWLQGGLCFGPGRRLPESKGARWRMPLQRNDVGAVFGTSTHHNLCGKCIGVTEGGAYRPCGQLPQAFCSCLCTDFLSPLFLTIPSLRRAPALPNRLWASTWWVRWLN